jgi:hypothetical protein
MARIETRFLPTAPFKDCFSQEWCVRLRYLVHQNRTTVLRYHVHFFFSTMAVPLSLRAASVTLPLASRLNSMVTPL